MNDRVELPGGEPEGTEIREEDRPVLVNVLTGERIVGEPGMSEELLYGLYANGML